MGGLHNILPRGIRHASGQSPWDWHNEICLNEICLCLVSFPLPGPSGGAARRTLWENSPPRQVNRATAGEEREVHRYHPCPGRHGVSSAGNGIEELRGYLGTVRSASRHVISYFAAPVRWVTARGGHLADWGNRSGDYRPENCRPEPHCCLSLPEGREYTLHNAACNTPLGDKRDRRIYWAKGVVWRVMAILCEALIVSLRNAVTEPTGGWLLGKGIGSYGWYRAVSCPSPIIGNWCPEWHCRAPHKSGCHHNHRYDKINHLANDSECCHVHGIGNNGRYGSSPP